MKQEVYIFKTLVPLEGDDWKMQSDADDISERNAFAVEYDRFLKVLEKIPKKDKVTYDEVFKKGIDKLCQYFNYPAVKLKDIGVRNNAYDGIAVTPVPVSVVRNCRKKIIDNTYHKVEGLYEGKEGEIFYNLIHNKLNSSKGCWLDKESCEEYINILDERIDAKNRDYDKDYKSTARVVRKEFKRFVSLSNKKYTMYAILTQNKKDII